MNKTAAVILVVVALLAAAGAGVGGYLLGKNGSGASQDPRGAFAQLTTEERTALQSMSAEERTAFFKEKGIDLPTGGPMGGGVAGDALGGPGGRPGGTVEGEVLSMDAETVTVKLAGGGSQKVYVDADTVKATADGSTAKLAVGAQIIVLTTPEADNVMAATAIIVK